MNDIKVSEVVKQQSRPGVGGKLDMKAYVVLSVSDLRRMLKAAQEKTKLHRLRGTKASRSCVIIKDLEVVVYDERLQVSSCDVTNVDAWGFAPASV